METILSYLDFLCHRFKFQLHHTKHENVKNVKLTSTTNKLISASEIKVGLGGLGVTCSHREPRFASTKQAEVDEFFSGGKTSEHKSSGRELRPWSRI